MTKIIQLRAKVEFLSRLPPAVRLLLPVALALFLAAPLAAESPEAVNASVAEPSGYRMDDYRGATPAALHGAKVVSTAEARALWASKSAICIDAMPRPPKPRNLPPQTIWRDQPRFNIPGSVWLVDVGYGALSVERDRYFREHLIALTGGDRNRPLLFYCKASCWMSWNAAKRAMEEYGYRNVIWYPEGTDGWEKAGFSLVEAEPAQ